MPKSTLTITDDRTGRTYVVPVERGVVRADDLGAIRLDENDDGLVVYDPGLHRTALCRSAIGTVDEDRGTLRYRGYPVEQLAEHGTYLETAYLIVKGHLPTAERYRVWEYNVKHHTLLHEAVRRSMEGFHYDAPPINILLGTIAILSSFYPDARDVLAGSLAATGAHVRIAESGAAALREWDRGPADLLICDLAMPEMDGFAVLAAIRARPA